MRRAHALLSATLAAAASIAAPAAASMRCAHALVGEGQTTVELTAACGPPAHVARRTVVTPGLTPGARVVEEVETWTYPGDTATLTRLVEVRRGVVARIATTGYRLAPEACGSPSVGTSAGELELACGPPLSRAAWAEERLDRRGAVRAVVQHERWTVSVGPGRFLRVIELEDGRVVRVTTGGRAP